MTEPGDTCDLLCLDLPHAERIRAALPSTEPLEAAAAAGRAAADPTRLAVAVALAVGDELCVCDLSWITGRSQNLVSHHLRALRSGGLAVSRRVGKLVMYRLTPLGSTVLDTLLPEGTAAARAGLGIEAPAPAPSPATRGDEADHSGRL